MKHPAYYNIISLSLLLVLMVISIILDLMEPFPITSFINNYTFVFTLGILILIFGFIGKSSVLVSHDHDYRSLASGNKPEKRGLYKILNFPLFESSFFMLFGLALTLNQMWMVLSSIVFIIVHVGYLHVFEKRSVEHHFRSK